MATQRPERNIILLVVAVGALSGVAWITNAFPPQDIPVIAAFFILLAAAVFSLARFATLHTRRSALITAGIVITLALRALNLRHPLYVLMLVSILVTLEISFGKFGKRS